MRIRKKIIVRVIIITSLYRDTTLFYYKKSREVDKNKERSYTIRNYERRKDIMVEIGMKMWERIHLGLSEVFMEMKGADELHIKDKLLELRLFRLYVMHPLEEAVVNPPFTPTDKIRPQNKERDERDRTKIKNEQV